MQKLIQYLFIFCVGLFSPLLFAAATTTSSSNNELPLADSDLDSTSSSLEATSPSGGMDYTGVYVDLSAGYAAVDWAGFNQGSFNGYSSFAGLVTGNDQGGFTFGADSGYRINPYLSVEMGWYYLPIVTGFSDVSPNLPSLKVKSWLAYAGFKPTLPLSKGVRRFEVFAKGGVGYRSLSYSRAAPGATGFGDDNEHYLTGVLGGGIQYWFDQNWSITAQYLHLWGCTDGSFVSKQAPGVNLILGSVGCQFGLY